jgi:hypothetical protein
VFRSIKFSFDKVVFEHRSFTTRDDRFLLYTDPHSRRIHEGQRSEGEPIKEWESLGQVLLADVNRFDRLFDERGVLRDPDAVLVAEEITPNRILGVKDREKGTFRIGQCVSLASPYSLRSLLAQILAWRGRIQC